MNTIKKLTRLLLAILALLTASGCMTVGAVNPTPAVTVIGDGSYTLDVAKVPDVIEPGRGVTLTDVRVSVENGFRNAVGESYRPHRADIALVFDSLTASIDEGQIGVLRVTYKARWVGADGKTIARAAGTAIPVNPIQTGAGHWRDTLEVMFGQIVKSLEKAQEKLERA